MAELMNSRYAREHCGDLLGIMDCTVNAMNTDACSDLLNSQQKQYLLKIKDFLRYVCVDKIDEISENEQCFRDVRTQASRNPDRCMHTVYQLQNCNAEPLIECNNEVIDEVPSCGPGAQDVSADIIRKMVEVVPGCTLKTQLNELYEKLYLLK